jgi:glycine cleavage system H protein
MSLMGPSGRTRFIIKGRIAAQETPMAEVRDELKYAKSHEWARIDGETATIGITDYAQNELTDIVYVETPEKGTKLEPGQEFGVVESVKSVSELYAPLGGEVVEVNEKLEDNPELINESPFEDGWIIKIKISDPSQADNLLSAADYQKATED